jgi:hypothetical protein
MEQQISTLSCGESVTLMPSFTYKSIWQEAQKVRWQVEDYITLVHLLHDALMEQVRLDVKSLERTLRRQFSGTDRQTLVEIQEQAYRWGFLCAGLTHPNFLKVLGDKGIQQDVSGNCEHLK